MNNNNYVTSITLPTKPRGTEYVRDGNIKILDKTFFKSIQSTYQQLYNKLTEKEINALYKISFGKNNELILTTTDLKILRSKLLNVYNLIYQYTKSLLSFYIEVYQKIFDDTANSEYFDENETELNNRIKFLEEFTKNIKTLEIINEQLNEVPTNAQTYKVLINKYEEMLNILKNGTIQQIDFEILKYYDDILTLLKSLEKTVQINNKQYREQQKYNAIQQLKYQNLKSLILIQDIKEYYYYQITNSNKVKSTGKIPKISTYIIPENEATTTTTTDTPKIILNDYNTEFYASLLLKTLDIDEAIKQTYQNIVRINYNINSLIGMNTYNNYIVPTTQTEQDKERLINLTLEARNNYEQFTEIITEEETMDEMPVYVAPSYISRFNVDNTDTIVQDANEWVASLQEETPPIKETINEMDTIKKMFNEILQGITLNNEMNNAVNQGLSENIVTTDNIEISTVQINESLKQNRIEQLKTQELLTQLLNTNNPNVQDLQKQLNELQRKEMLYEQELQGLREAFNMLENNTYEQIQAQARIIYENLNTEIPYEELEQLLYENETEQNRNALRIFTGLAFSTIKNNFDYLYPTMRDTNDEMVENIKQYQDISKEDFEQLRAFVKNKPAIPQNNNNIIDEANPQDVLNQSNQINEIRNQQSINYNNLQQNNNNLVRDNQLINANLPFYYSIPYNIYVKASHLILNNNLLDRLTTILISTNLVYSTINTIKFEEVNNINENKPNEEIEDPMNEGLGGAIIFPSGGASEPRPPVGPPGPIYTTIDMLTKTTVGTLKLTGTLAEQAAKGTLKAGSYVIDGVTYIWNGTVWVVQNTTKAVGFLGSILGLIVTFIDFIGTTTGFLILSLMGGLAVVGYISRNNK